MQRSGFMNRAMFQGMLRLGVKLDFIAGLLIKATEAAGNKKTPRVQANVGEVITWRNVIWGLTDGMIEGCEPWSDGSVQPNCAYTLAVPVLGPQIYGRVKEIIEHTVGSSLIYLNSNAADFKNPEMRGFLDQYLRGSEGYTSVDRAKVMKLLWDALGSEFGGRHERNYAGNAEDTRRMVLSRGPRRRRRQAVHRAGRAVHDRVRPRRLDDPRVHRPGRHQPVGQVLIRLPAWRWS